MNQFNFMEKNKMLFNGKNVSSAILLLAATQASGFGIKNGHAIISLGGYLNSTGKTQNVDITGLVGDIYTITSHNKGNVIVGAGYFLNNVTPCNFNFAYGIDAFYLGKTQVSGTIFQEHLFPNLAYQYNISHVPVYAEAKLDFNNTGPKYSFAVNAGIGPNFMQTSNFYDYSLDDITLPDRAFSGHTNTTFSAMAGVSIKINNVIGQRPLECGYRFFYLGKGNLAINNSQIQNTLSTGTNYANALLCSVAI